jgi:hypothetical protein
MLLARAAVEQALDVDAFRAGLLAIKDEEEAKAMSRWYVNLVASYFVEHGVPGPSVKFYASDIAVGFKHEWNEAQAGRRLTTMH